MFMFDNISVSKDDQGCPSKALIDTAILGSNGAIVIKIDKEYVL